MNRRLIMYTEEQRAAIAAVADAGRALDEARAATAAATNEARAAVRHALTLGIHYKELRGLSQSFTYRVLSDMRAA